MEDTEGTDPSAEGTTGARDGDCMPGRRYVRRGAKFNFPTWDEYVKDTWDNPEWVMSQSSWKLFGGDLFAWYYDTRERADRQKMDSDLEKNTGQTWKNSPYPFYSYRNDSYTGSFGDRGTYGALLDEFGVNDSIINQFNKRLYKW